MCDRDQASALKMKRWLFLAVEGENTPLWHYGIDEKLLFNYALPLVLN